MLINILKLRFMQVTQFQSLSPFTFQRQQQYTSKLLYEWANVIQNPGADEKLDCKRSTLIIDEEVNIQPTKITIDSLHFRIHQTQINHQMKPEHYDH